jgi:nitrous oxidase accessory protein NosD
MNKQPILLLTMLLLAFAACQKDSLQSPEPLKPDDGHYFVPDLNTISTRSNCPWTVIPAGSVDALANAIANTCDGGGIYLKAGLHTETKPLVIRKRVLLIGETGAILKIKSDLAPPPPGTTYVAIEPGIYVMNANGTLIQNLTIQPLSSDGGTAILIENAHNSAVMGCTFTGFQFAVVVELSDRVAIMRNKITGTDKWVSGEVADCYSIMVVNGKSAYVAENEVTNSIFGIWACDQWGTCVNNNAHDNYVGIILCTVPIGLI